METWQWSVKGLSYWYFPSRLHIQFLCPANVTRFGGSHRTIRKQVIESASALPKKGAVQIR